LLFFFRIFLFDISKQTYTIDQLFLLIVNHHRNVITREKKRREVLVYKEKSGIHFCFFKS